jgi:hypothetical protein
MKEGGTDLGTQDTNRIPLPAGGPEQAASTALPVLSYQSQNVATTLFPGVSAEGDVLVLISETGAFVDHEVNELPKRCVRCNGPADDPIDVRLVWLSPDGMPPVAARRAVVRFWFCDKHASNYRRSAWVGICVFSAGVLTLALGFPLAVFLGIGTNESRGLQALALIAAGLFMMVLGPAVMGLGKIRALRIDRQTVCIGGCGKPFLDSLPPMVPAREVPNASSLSHP